MYYTMLLYHKLQSFVYHQIFPVLSRMKLPEIFRSLSNKVFGIKYKIDGELKEFSTA